MAYGYTPEQELILVARGICEIAEALEAQGQTLTGPGVTYARSLDADAKQGTRGLLRSEQPPMGSGRETSWPEADKNAGFSLSHGWTGMKS